MFFPRLSPAAPPNVIRLSPLGVIPGRPATLTFSGENLSGATELWTSFESEPVLEHDGHAPVFRFKLPSRVSPGLGAVRLVTTNGMSSLHLVLFDVLPSLAATGTNRTPASAQRLTGPVAVDGTCSELGSAFYRVTAKRGQRMAIEVVAQRLGSPMDPLLRVLDASGRELAVVEDSPGLGADARIDFKAPRGGDYFIEIRDTRYAGGPRHRYRLRLGELLSNNLPFFAATNLSQFAASDGEALPVVTERESGAGQVQTVTTPCEIAGQFAKAGDRDVFAFHARKGERLIFSGRTRSLGSPADLWIQIQSTNGTRIAEGNPMGADEGALTNRFAEAGIYHLVVEELNGSGGPAFGYRVAVQPWTPGFRLSAESERFSVPAGDSFEISVRADRRDYDGPIALKLVGLAGTFAVTNAVIPAKATNTAKFQVTVPTDLALGDFFEFGVVGSAEIGGSNVTARVSTMPALRAAFPDLRRPPAELDGMLSLSVSESRSSTPIPRKKRRN